jgi:SH3-like domain-containing protein
MSHRDRSPVLAATRIGNDLATVVRAGVVLLIIVGAALFAGLARGAEGSETGLPLPRFATTRDDPVNVRVGPGERYKIAWVYVKAGMPVEIIEEFDTWRKIRDVDGSEGWVHQNLLSGKRVGIAAPWRQQESIPLLSGRGDSDGVRAFLAAGLRVQIARCDGSWCEVSATGSGENAPSGTFSGYLRQSELWGVYEGEEFD